MKGWDIFLYSVRQVTENLEGALRVSLIPYAIQVAAGLILMGRHAEALADPTLAKADLLTFAALISSVVTIAASLWVAVAWHRFILLNEKPQGLIPRWRGDRILAYFLFLLGFGVILVVVGVIWLWIVGMALGPLAAGMGFAGNLLIGALIQLPLAVIALRLTSALPGAAVAKGTGFLAGWKATEGHSVDIVGLAIAAVTANFVLGMIGGLLVGNLWLLALGWQVITGWLVTMVGISMLTTLYRQYVEGRPVV